MEVKDIIEYLSDYAPETKVVDEQGKSVTGLAELADGTVVVLTGEEEETPELHSSLTVGQLVKEVLEEQGREITPEQMEQVCRGILYAIEQSKLVDDALSNL